MQHIRHTFCINRVFYSAERSSFSDSDFKAPVNMASKAIHAVGLNQADLYNVLTSRLNHYPQNPKLYRSNYEKDNIYHNLLDLNRNFKIVVRF